MMINPKTDAIKGLVFIVVLIGLLSGGILGVWSILGWALDWGERPAGFRLAECSVIIHEDQNVPHNEVHVQVRVHPWYRENRRDLEQAIRAAVRGQKIKPPERLGPSH